MKIVENDQLKKIEINILSKIDELCKQNNLKYFICGGTLLGAVRHKGFIPWDDDIDICMPRSDYNKLADLMEQDKDYMILSSVKDGYYYVFPKAVDRRTLVNEKGYKPIKNLGVSVDIFLLDGMPEDERKSEYHYKKLKKVRSKITGYSLLKPKIGKNVFFYAKRCWVYYIINRYRRLEDMQKQYSFIAEKFKYETSAYVYATGGAYGKKDIFRKEIFEDEEQLEFEGRYFSAPAKWDEYLRQLYGDYMQLPPIEKRVMHHNLEAIYIEK